MFDSLEKHSLDLIIDSSPLNNIYSNTVVKKVAYLDTCFIRSQKNQDTILNLDDLCNCEIILPVANSSHRKALEKNLNSIGVKLNPMFELPTEELIIESVKRNLGVGFVVESAVKNLIDAKVVEKVEIKHKLPKVEINAVYKDNFLPKLGRIFLRDYVKIDDDL